MNLYTDLELWNDESKGLINTIVEIPLGSMVKYEFNKELNVVEVDRFFTCPMPIPYNYGFLPRSYNSDDKDPLDVILLGQYPIQAGAICTAKVIGVLHMIDGGEMDDKIIAIPNKEPYLGSIEDINEVNQHVKNQIEFFLSTYKTLEKKKTELKGFEGKDVAMKIIKQSEIDYKNLK